MFAAMTTAPQPAAAQTARPSSTSPRVQQPSFELPPVVPPAGTDPAVVGGRPFFLKQVQLLGSTALTAAEIDEITAPFLNRIVTVEDIDELRQRVTLAYLDRGYINSGALIPEQQIADGRLKIQVIEGRISQIDIAGLDHLRQSYIRDRLLLESGPPFNINALQRRMQI